MRASAIALIVGGACFAETSDDVARQEHALDPPGDPFLNTVLPSDPVGGSTGTFSVTDDGAATYTLPLWVPSGRAGMQPDLSLSYHSGSGPSEVGLGWQVGGLSSIRRCPRDLTRDTGVRGVQFDAMDRFCLDGQRLVLVSGSYGAAGSEYRVERNGFAKITLGAASVFTVKSRDGRTTTYAPIEAWQGAGSAEHAFSPAALVNFAWVATRVEDRAGNFMTMTPLIQADPDFGAWRLGIQEIRYTGHASLGAGQRTVTFVYDTAERPDETIAFAAGVGVRAHRLLKRIEMRAPGEPNLLRVYQLSHAVSRSTGRSLLASIRECDGFGICLEPIVFGYGDDEAVYDELDPRSIEIVTSIPTEEGWLDGTTTDYSVFGLGVSHQPVTPMDFNGDGHDDLVIGRQSDGLNTWIAHPNRGPGVPAFGPGISLGLFHSTPVTLGVFDHDHDGDDALIAVNPDTFRARLLDVHAGGVTVVDPDLGRCGDRNQRIVTGDVDFNGSDDIVANCLEGTESHSYKLRRHAGGDYGVFPATPEEFRHVSDPLGMPHVTSDAMFRVLIDHRGDGSREWLYHDTEATPANWRWDASSSAAGTFDSTLPRVTSGPSIAFLDANGDGLEDVLDTATMHLLVNIGRGFVDAGPAIIPGTGPDVSAHLEPDERDLRVVNLNGDGRDDFVIAYFPTATVPAKLVAYVSEGVYFRASSLLTPGRDIPLFVGRNSWSPFQPLDIDEDSIADFVYIHGTSDHLAIRHNLRDVPDLLTEVNDWHGRYTASYAPLTDEAIHTPLVGCAYPLRCTNDPAVRVVHRHETPDGGLYTHSYEGARSHVRGEAWLGFDEHRVVQDVTGLIEITKFAIDLTSPTQPARHYGARLPLRRATMAPLGGGVYRGWVVDYTWTYRPLEGSTTHHAVVMTERFDRELEIGGWNGAEIPPVTSAFRTIHTEIWHDSHGNVEHEEQTHASATATSAQRILHFSMTNDPATWTIGRVDALVETDFDDTLTAHVNRRTHYGYDARGILNRTTRQPSSPDEQETRYTLDAFGQTTAMTEEDAGGVARTTTLAYDAESIFPRRAWNALDHLTTTYIHPGLGAPVLVVDPNGVERRATYDGFGRLRGSSHSASAGASFRYEPRPGFLPGMQVHVVGGDGSERFSEYSRLGLLEVNRTLGFDGRFAREEFNYDPRLRMTQYRASAFPGEPVTSTTYTYDNLDRVTAVGFADGTSYTTAYPPNQVRVTHPNGRVSEARFDARGRITSSIERNLGTGFRDTRYWYAPFDRVARVVRGTSSVSTLATWTFAWDVYGRLTSVSDPDTGTRGFEYNGWNELFARVDATGARTEFYRDALGRVYSEERPDGTTDYVWDTAAFGIGRLHRAFSPDGVETEQQYNSAGQESAVIRRVDGRTFTTSFGYDSSGRLSDIAYPTGGIPLRTRYEYSRGLLARVLRTDTPAPSTLWEATVRDANGRPKTELFSALVAPTVTSRTYDPVTNRLASVVTTTTPPTGVPTRVQDLRFTYTRHALTRMTDLLGGRTENYVQDEFDRLKRWEPTDAPAQDYTYDALDNLTRLGTRTLTYGDPNKPHTPTAIGGLAVTHDPNGRRLTASGFNATYTHFDLPRTLNGTALRYDPFQERAVKTSGGTTTYYAGGHYELSLSSTGVATHTYRVLAEGRAVAELTYEFSTGKTKLFNLHDSAVGNTETITDSAGFVAARYRYEPFGRRTTVPASYYGSRRGFTGHEHDDEVGMINMRGRIYDPSSGRFLTPDPIAAGIGRGIAWNRYAYVQNNPLNARDPSGFQMCDGDAPGCPGGDLDGDGTAGAGTGPPDTTPWTPGPVGPEDAAWSMLPQGFAEAFAQAMCRTEECMDAEVARTPIGRLIAAMRDFVDQLADFAAVVGTLASGFVPGLGELMDVYVLLTSSDDAELRAAGVSLGASIGLMIAGLEFAPNYASIRLADDVLEASGGRMMRATFLNRGDPAGGSLVGIVTRGSDGFRLANGRPPEPGTYDFVVQNGQLRIGNSHYHLSGGQPVEFAGAITFGHDGALLQWTNGSGHFMPSAAFARNAGLPLDAFRPVWIPAMVGTPQLPVFREP